MRKIVLLIVFVYVNFISANTGFSWKPVEGQMITQWGRTINPEKPLPEYPRPSMVRSEWVNLNGLWNYEITAISANKPPVFNQNKKILVPFAIESALSGVKERLTDNQRLWYQRNFTVPPGWKGKRVLLNFGAVDYQCVVFINGKKVGQHAGSSDSFRFDITGALKPEGNQRLVVAVTDPTDKGRQPRGKQVNEPKGIYYTPVSGIWKTVWMEPVNEQHILHHRGVADIDKGTYRVNTVLKTIVTDEKIRVTAYLNGKQVAQTSVEGGKPAILKIKKPKLWSPDSPTLYDMKIELLKNNIVIDSYDSYFGMRKISIARDANGIPRLMVNNQFIFQYGLLDQGWWPDGLLTAPSEEALLYDIEFTKKAGYNTIRKHIKIESERFYYHCDRIGLLVWQDAVSGDLFNFRNPPKNHQKDSVAARQFENELRRMVVQLRNHPSIIKWVVFNEGWGQYGENTILELTKKLDPTRPATISGWVDFTGSDVADVHRYPSPGRVEASGHRPFVVGEFGGLGLPVEGKLWNKNMRNWGYSDYTNVEDMKKVYKNYVRQLELLIHQGLSGAIYTQTTDVEGEINGMLTYDRSMEKIQAAELHKIHTPLYAVQPPRLKVLLPGSEIQPQNWKYTFTQPEKNWFREKFDDSNWMTGKGLFGFNHPDWQTGYPVEERTAFANLPKTEWKTPEIWIRREFTLTEVPKQALLAITYDDEAEVYINGTLVAKVTGRPAPSKRFEYVDFMPGTLKVLRKGKNSIAVKAVNDVKARGNAAIDVGIVAVE